MDLLRERIEHLLLGEQLDERLVRGELADRLHVLELVDLHVLVRIVELLVQRLEQVGREDLQKVERRQPLLRLPAEAVGARSAASSGPTSPRRPCDDRFCASRAFSIICHRVTARAVDLRALGMSAAAARSSSTPPCRCRAARGSASPRRASNWALPRESDRALDDRRSMASRRPARASTCAARSDVLARLADRRGRARGIARPPTQESANC